MVDACIFIARAICHQLPERSIMINGSHLPFCARCTGIYLGILLSVIFLIFKKRLDSNKPFGLYVTIVAAGLLALMTADGLTSYAGLRLTNNFNRIISGVLFGINLPLLYVLANNFKTEDKNEKDILTSREYTAIVAIALMLALAVYNGLITSWSFVSALLCISMVLTVCFAVNFISKVFNMNKGLRYFASIGCSVILITTISVVRGMG